LALSAVSLLQHGHAAHQFTKKNVRDNPTEPSEFAGLKHQANCVKLNIKPEKNLDVIPADYIAPKIVRSANPF